MRLLDISIVECKKYRTAATNNPSLEGESLREIGFELDRCKKDCIETVKTTRVNAGMYIHEYIHTLPYVYRMLH